MTSSFSSNCLAKYLTGFAFIISVSFGLLACQKSKVSTNEVASTSTPKEAADDIKEGMIAANGQNFHYLYAGKKGNPMILFVHGYPEYSGKWKNYLKHFSKDYYVVAPDLRGYNLSSKPQNTEDYKISILAEDLRQIVYALGYKEEQGIQVVSHDWGAMITWVFVEKNENLVRSSTVLNGVHPKALAEVYLAPGSKQPAASHTYVPDAVAENAPAHFAENDYQYLKDFVFNKSIATFSAEEQEGYMNAWKQPDAIKSMVQYYKAFNPFVDPFIQSLKGVKTVPVLMFWGHNDSFTVDANLPATLRYAAVHETPVEFADATHWLTHEKEAEIIPKMEAFFSKHKVSK